jgi:triacylglycerol esterase/lipase EstA (alpha/beta hydrolase family)
MAKTLSIKITGRADAAALPPLLAGPSRAAGAAPDPFLPASYLRATATFDVGSAARSTEGAAAHEHAAAAGEVVVLELADGSTLITSAERLYDTLERTHPDWLEDGAIPFEKLRAAGAAPGRGLGEATGGLVSKVYTFVAGEAPDKIIDVARDWLEQKGLGAAELGITWAGTKALMWAIESQLAQAPGLYRWVGASGKAEDLVPPDATDFDRAVADQLPMLVFVHGTGSSSLGSFGELRVGDRDLWAALERHFTGGIYAFEHRTLSESPIENALQLARALPKGACINLVSHSRGGLVADLLCLTDFDAQIDAFARPKNLPGTGDADPDSDAAKAVAVQLDDAYGEHRAGLRELATALRDKQLSVQRYVRAASPANGTKLASGNFDLFLSGLLTLIGQVPFFFGSPFYAAFKRVVVEIAKNRTNPHLVPGIEAMLPDSPMARLLRDAPVRPGLTMSVIAGDIQGGNLLQRLGVLLTDFLLFDRDDNDLVVNTPAMLAGIAPRAGSRVLFDRGADVSHFRYFTNIGTRSALRDWLVEPDPATLDTFHALPDPRDYAAALAAAARGALATDRPVVVVLPGVMGSHLQVGGNDRVWFDPIDIATGGLGKIEWGKPGVEAEDLFGMIYGDLCKTLADSHRVERFAYDWRQPLDVLAERFGEFLDRLMKETQQPIRLLAHSMGGLVVRACIHRRRPVMDALMARDGARLVMLGTPHQGAHSMVENLIGKGDTLRALVRLDVAHSMQQVLDIVAGFRGALQLLPKPGFTDMFQGQSDGGGAYDYQKAQTWVDFQPKVKDFWFGNGRIGKPSQQVLDSAAWLWSQDGPQRPSLPPEYEKKSSYVFGVARNTPCGVREDAGRLKMVGTSHGDGTVSWESGRIGGIGQFFYMPAEHGDLPATREYFPALVDLLNSGTTTRLLTAPPASRAIEQPQPVSYDAGPPTADDPDMLARSLLGGSLRNRMPPRRKRRLEVRVQAKDLRFLSQPILVGHYEQDPIAGPERLIDDELLGGDLSERHRLGLYAGPLGTATVVLRVPNEVERRRGSLRGAVVTGLGRYDGALSRANLTEAVRAGALRYLLQVIDVLGKDDREVSLATLLLGYNSSANLTVDASVEALVRGVMEANARFYDTTRLNIRITRLDIIELYVDTAITAVYALRDLASRLAAPAEQQHTELVCRTELERGEGMRPRLFDNRSANYWPRLIVTDAEPDAARALPAPGEAPATALADTLRFLYVGQRARAESVLQQRQPGLIERLVHQQIHDAAWNEDFGRMLFQLMVPHDFKDTARQLDQLVLVVDRTTANLPWELMLADDPSHSDGDKRPLALRTAVVRQLSSTRFRRQVRQNIERTALVIGNPSVKGFAAAFSTPQAPITAEPPDLRGAQAEAVSVARLLSAMDYDVTPVIGGDAAVTVLAALYHRPWRILHISAHGVFGLRHSDGRDRSGVLLSDGLLITAAEVEAMEVVPELVFLNCCHLGTVDAWREGNKLAASVSRELIDIGVRCVVVAGWAVNDEGAQRFGETFYQELLLRRRPFGDAVFAARKAVWDFNPQDITWGAFQAYGDPAWRAEPRSAGDAGQDDGPFASPEELLDALARTRAEVSHRRDRMSDRDSRGQTEALEALQKNRCPPGWLNLPVVQSALGATWYDLNQFDRARAALLQAVQAEDKAGTVPIHDIEKLANAEARLGERRGADELRAAPGVAGVRDERAKGSPPRERVAPGAPADESAASLVEQAIKRLHTLDTLAAKTDALAFNPERSALLGSACKRKANLCALSLLAAARSRGDKAPTPAERARGAELAQAMSDALRESAEAYRRDEGSPGSSHFSSYLALNRLALEALSTWPEVGATSSPIESARQAGAVELARQCRHYAELAYASSADLWDAVMQPEALMVEKLNDRSLGQSGDAGQVAFDALAAAYGQALANVTVKPAQLDSVVSQMELLSRFCDALAVARSNADLYRAASRLLALLQRVHPSRRPRDDRPMEPAEPAAAPRKARRRRKN